MVSRECSLLGRAVLTGKLNLEFLVTGKKYRNGAMAKFFQNGDFRSGYYRDQT
jgi:hypothetical protein